MGTQTLKVSANVKVIIVTHGDKYTYPNPEMTPIGKEEIAALKHLLPDSQLFQVVCGTGRRHNDVAKTLGLKVTTYTPTAGGPDSLESIGDLKVVILSDGTRVPFDQYSLIGQDQAACELIKTLDQDTIICAGRPLLISLGITDGKSAAVYEITGDEIKTISEGISVGAGDKEV